MLEFRNLGKYGPKKFYNVTEDQLGKVTKKAALEYSRKDVLKGNNNNGYSMGKEKRAYPLKAEPQVDKDAEKPGPGAYNVK